MKDLRMEAALHLIALEGCESSTAGPGSCLKPGSGRSMTAHFGGDQACSSCIAMWGLGLVDDHVHSRPDEVDP
jgi:hypothetical protein